MSIVKRLDYRINKRGMQLDFPSKKTIVLRGRLNETVLYIIESLLANDFTNNNFHADERYGVSYFAEPEKACIYFSKSSIIGANYSVRYEGDIPKVHVIRCLGDGDNIRSFLVSDNFSNYESIYSNMKNYSSVISDSKWLRLINTVNDTLGFEFVMLKRAEDDEEDSNDIDEKDNKTKNKVSDKSKAGKKSKKKKLVFNLVENYPIPIKGQKLIYLLMSECFLTPKYYHRILLLSDIRCLDSKTQVRFLEILDNIGNHSLTLSCANIQPSDVRSNSVVTIMNV